MNNNALVTRFEENADFSAMIDQAVGDLTAEWIDSGKATRLVDEVAARVPATDDVGRAAIDADVQTVKSALVAQDGA